MSDEDPTKYELLQNYRKFLHDCNNVLVGISGNAGLAKMLIKDNKKRKDLGKFIEASCLACEALAETIIVRQEYVRGLMARLEEENAKLIEDPRQMHFEFWSSYS